MLVLCLKERPNQQGVPGINLLEGNLLIGSKQDEVDSQTFSGVDSKKLSRTWLRVSPRKSLSLLISYQNDPVSLGGMN